MDKKDRREYDCYELCQFPMASLRKLSAVAARAPRSFGAAGSRSSIMPHPDYGMPEPLDMEVWVIMLQLTGEQGVPREVGFTRAEFLRRLGWPDSRYGRLMLALDRWLQTTYESRIRIRAHDDVLIKQLRMLQEVTYSEKGRLPGSFVWHERMHRLLQETYHRVEIDVGLYLSLKSPVAQAIYRYLSARCWRRDQPHTEPLLSWARNRLGIQEVYRSKIERHLLPALDQLVAVAFLAGYTVEGEQIRFFFPPEKRLMPEKRLEKAAAPLESTGDPEDGLRSPEAAREASDRPSPLEVPGWWKELSDPERQVLRVWLAQVEGLELNNAVFHHDHWLLKIHGPALRERAGC